MGAPSPSPDDSGVVAIGSVLDGRYRIDAVLGKGGMGRVYRGEHTGIGRAVAIKVLHAQLGRSKEATQRFQREALASGRLDHPNIVGVSDFGVLDDGCLYLVMEALEGEPLGARLERDHRIPWPEALEILRGVLAGLRHAHDRGVVHRDIKPDNIFLARKDGEQFVKILDFGIAKLFAGNADDPATTRAGLTVGTPAYLSPEQAVGGAITPASDLYSSSVLLYEMLTGRPPFEDTDPLAVLTAHVSREPPSFADVAPGIEIPQGLEAVIRHGLAKMSAERIGSAIDYQRALDDVLRAAGYDAAIAVMPRASGQMRIPTPPPGSLVKQPSAPRLPTSDPTVSLTPVAQRSVSLADISDPIPRKWIIAAIAFVVLAIAGAVALKLRSGGPSAPHGAPPPAVVPVLAPTAPPIDRDTRLKAAIHDLEDGETCADRKAAIAPLVQLKDDRAIAALKQARYRMRGGIAGVGESNTNACLTKEADAAIKTLSR